MGHSAEFRQFRPKLLKTFLFDLQSINRTPVKNVYYDLYLKLVVGIGWEKHYR